MIPTEAFTQIDKFSEDHVIKPDAGLDKCMQNARDNGLPDISVSAIQGKFLYLQAKMMKAKRVLEIGTLAGYSSIWLAKALPGDGELITLESNEKFAELSRQNIANSAPECSVQVIHGAALDTLAMLEGTFDMVFIDADKPNSANYLRKAVELTHPGSVIYVDNTVRNYAILLDEHTRDPYGIGIRAVYPALQELQNEGKIEATNIQIASSKGHDGLAVACTAIAYQINPPEATVEKYVEPFLIGEDPVLTHTVSNSLANGLPPIRVSATQGKFLMMQARLVGARRILEVGTLGGYSSIWLARALPSDGKLLTCEFDERYAEVARDNIAHAGLSDKVEVKAGKALDIINTLNETFDFVFIDADKNNSPNYLAEAVKLTRKGAIIVVDNTVQNAHAFMDPQTTSANVLGNRKVYALLQELERQGKLTATHQQCANEKGTDAFAIAVREQVEDYAEQHLITADDALEHAKSNIAKYGLPPISLNATLAKFFMMLAQLVGARRILEIGTLGGYSTIWLAKALPSDGQIITCEYDENYAKVARENVEYAGLGQVVDIHVGDALQSIAKLDDTPFDYVFIDADKKNSAKYLQEAVKCTRKGGIIAIDNTVLNAAEFVNPNTADPAMQGNRQVYTVLQESEKRGEIIATHQQTHEWLTEGSDAIVIAVRL
ncbi:hypothetical protein E3P99_02709 [Wallemia hederae]|uniref:O-methyltransferase n=1 Tax=Wallemia hederae TaxID=1540922 RepID=A0A4T0FKJ8_9BASI|nr:hypothetical protein E3P99_02709 [Wallemia hederae]